MGSDDRSPTDPPGPYILHPEYWSRGPQPARQMLYSDLRLQGKFTQQCPVEPRQHFQPPTAASIPFLAQPTLENADVQALKDYLAGIDANIMVPQPPAPKKPEEDEPTPTDGTPTKDGWQFSGTGASLGSKDGGVSVEDRRGIREYLSSGYTRRNPDGFRNPDGTWNTIRRDDDFRGKWDDHAEIAGAKAEHDLFSAAVAKGSFGEGDDAFGGSGSILGASGKASGQFSFTQEGASGISPGLRTKAGAEAEAAFARGQIGTRPEYVDNSQTLAGGQASGSAVSGKAEAAVEAILTAEQATLGGKLGAEINLIEGKLEADLVITPRRVVNGVVNLWNWAFDGDVAEPLGENWDIGLTIGGEVSGQVGAQAGAEARAGYEKGRARAEAGAKIGLGVGAGVKGRVGVVGIDRVWQGAKSLGRAAWDGASSGGRSAWNWARRD